MKTNLRRYAYVACIVCAGESASHADTTTNGVELMPPFKVTTYNYTLPQRSAPATTWPSIWHQELEKRTEMYGSDTFGWQSMLNWTRQLNDGANLNVAYANAGKKVMRRAFVNSLREATVELPGVFNSKTLLNDLIKGTFGHTTEESIQPVGITPVASQTSWWQEMRSGKNIIGGFRPLDGNMYGAIRGGQLDGHPLYTALFRWKYDPVLLRSSIDEQVSLLLPRSTALIIGSSYELVNIHNNDHKLNWSLTITHAFDSEWDTTWNHGMIVAGVSGDNRGLLASVQVNVPWPH